MRKSKPKSVRNMLLFPMVAINLLIVLIFISSVLSTGFIQILRNSEVSNLQRTVDNRTQRINRLTNEISGLALSMTREIAADVGAKYNSVAVSGLISRSPNATSDILQIAVPHLVDAISYNRATGAFIILNSSVLYSGQAGSLAAVYLNDEDMSASHMNRSDLSLFYGPQQISRELSAFLNNSWSVELSLDDYDDDAFFKMPLEAVGLEGGYNLAQLGYWSHPVKRPDGTSVIMHTLPLVDSSGRAYGVVGLELSVPHLLQGYMDISDIGSGKDAFYRLAAFDISNNILWSIDNGIYAGVNRYENADIAWSELPGNREWRLDIEYPNNKAVAVANQFSVLYSDNPYQEAYFGLIGGVDTSRIFSNINLLFLGLVLVVSISLVVGVLLSVMSANWLSSPLKRLAGELRTIDPDDEIRLTLTKITEIDSIINAMEELSSDLVETGSRTLKSIEMTEMPIGFFEINNLKSRVFVTDILCGWFPELDCGQNFLALDAWEGFYRRLTRHRVETEQNVYQYDSQNRRLWYRMKTASDSTRTFGIIMDITEEMQRRKQLELERDTDSLTGLLNRKAFFRMAEERIANDPGHKGLMIFADLDTIKTINDTYGHDCGDSYIQMAAKAFLRYSHYGALVGRISGDEFAVFMYGFGENAQALAIINENEQRFEQMSLMLPDGKDMKLRCSTGVAWYPQDSSDLDMLLRYADFATSEAKYEGGTNQFSAAAYARRESLSQKKEAFNLFIDENLVNYAMQPIVDIYSGKIFAYEALMRPSAGLFESPRQVLEFAREQGRLFEVERMTVFNIYKWVSENNDKLAGKPVFYNSLPDQPLSERDMELLEQQYSVAFGQIVAEVIDSKRNDIDAILSKFTAFRKLGTMLAVDDYGVGYSNPIMLLSLKPDFIKIDMSLIRGIHLDINKQKMVSNIIDYAKPRGMKVIAEGVECFEEAQTLIRVGVDYLQGYYLAVPSIELDDISEDVRAALRSVAEKYRYDAREN